MSSTIYCLLFYYLRPEADSPELTWVWESGYPGDAQDIVFRYRVPRVWQTPSSAFLIEGMGLLPLAPISDVTEADLPGIIDAIHRQVARAGHSAEVGEIWTATGILVGLRYPQGCWLL